MARNACSAADQRQEAALKRKVSLVGRSFRVALLRCWPAASLAKACLYRMLTAECLQTSASLRGSDVRSLQCMQGGLDERELRELIKKRFKGLLVSAKTKRNAPVEADLADARRALAAMEAERKGSAAQAQASLSTCQTARTQASGIGACNLNSAVHMCQSRPAQDWQILFWLSFSLPVLPPITSLGCQGSPLLLGPFCANTLDHAGMPPSRSA